MFLVPQARSRSRRAGRTGLIPDRVSSTVGPDDLRSVRGPGRTGTWSHPLKGEGMSQEPKGRRVQYRRAQFTESGIAVHGSAPLLLVYVRAGNRFRKSFLYHCKQNGITIAGDAPRWEGGKGEVLEYRDGVPVYERGYVACYEVTGAPIALERLTGCSFVESWTFVLDSSIPFAPSGQGTEDDLDRARARQKAARRKLADEVAKRSPFSQW